MTTDKKYSKLTPKQARFCQEYLLDLNATQAAIRAGYSQKTARFIAAENLSKLNIQNRISELQKQASQKIDITKQEVLGVLANIIRSDPGNYFQNGKLRSLSDLPPDARKSIESLKFGKKDIHELKFASRLQAIQILNRMMGWDEAKNVKLLFEAEYEQLKELLESAPDEAIDRIYERLSKLKDEQERKD